MREIVLDTETTGLDPASGHRVVEIGCIELVNHMRTGQHFHTYLNPERDMPHEAERVHGLSASFLATHPRFAEQVELFEAFIGADRLIAHNATFDIKFLNSELGRLKRPLIVMTRVTDTLEIARKRYPGAHASLDGLCRRFGIDLSIRESNGHGALLDAQLLADVYLELMGGREPGLGFDAARAADAMAAALQKRLPLPPRPTPLAPLLTAEELAAHQTFLASFPTTPLWNGIAAA
jgi:DNA polymerase-3 subunit epsilon